MAIHGSICDRKYPSKDYLALAMLFRSTESVRWKGTVDCGRRPCYSANSQTTNMSCTRRCVGADHTGWPGFVCFLAKAPLLQGEMLKEQIDKFAVLTMLLGNDGLPQAELDEPSKRQH
jgi:hypothetical protein